VGGRTWQSRGAKAIPPMPSPLAPVAVSLLAASVLTDLASLMARAHECDVFLLSNPVSWKRDEFNYGVQLRALPYLGVLLEPRHISANDSYSW
jgi:hypothetical protein